MIEKRTNNAWTTGAYSRYERNTPTFENTTSLAIYSDGTPIDSYEFYGNCYQDSTPTPTVPVEVECFGNLIASDNNAGKYDIPITSGGTTNHIILTEPLRKIGNYADTVDSEGVVTRRIGKYEFTGNENFTKESLGYTPNRYHGTNILSNCGNNLLGICTHYKYEVANTYGNLFVSSNKTDIFILDSSITSATDFKTFLAQQYANNTPVTVYYVLATAVTESYSINMIKDAFVQGTISSSGVILNRTNRIRSTFIEVNASETYTFNNSNLYIYSVSGWNGNKFVSEISNQSSSVTKSLTFTIPSGINKVSIIMKGNQAGTVDITPSDIQNPMLNIGTSALPYEPYKTMPTIPISSGNSTITIGTSLAPSKVELDMGKMFVPHVEKVRVNGAWV